MATYTNAIQKLYVAYFSRPADAAGLAWWEGVVAGANGDTSMISAAFAGSLEYQMTFAGKTEHEVVRTVYTNLFGREAEPAGVDYWANALINRVLTIDVVVTAIASGAQGADLVAFDNKVEAATAFTGALDTHPERAAYNGDDALAAARGFIKTVTDDASLAQAIAPAALDASVAAFVAASKAPIAFTLTANSDNGVAFTGGGGPDTFSATGLTFNAGDVLNGGGGVDTMHLDDSQGIGLAALPAQARLANIENFNIITAGGFGTAGAAYDTSGFTGLNHLGVQAKGAINAKIADTVSGAFTTTSGAITVAGGKSIHASGFTAPATLTGNAITDVFLFNTNQATTIVNTTAGHTLNLTLIAVPGGATIKDAAATTVNLAASVDWVGGPGVDVNLDIAKATLLNLENGGVLKLTTTALAAADMLQSITLKGGGIMSADLSGILPFVSFDASSYAGTTALTIASATNLSVKGGSGADSIVMTGPLSGTAVVQLGAGSDTYDFSRAAQKGARVDGGFGYNDTLVVNDAALLQTEGGNVYTNFETLVFSSGKGVYDLDLAGSVTRLDASKQLREAVEFINGRANTMINLMAEAKNYDIDGVQTESFVPHSDIKFNLKDATGASDMLMISLTAYDGLADGEANGTVQAATIEATGIETVRLHSDVAFIEGDNPATPMNEASVAADYFNMISYLRIDGTKTLTVAGSASLSLTSIYSNSVTTFDASAATGNINFAGVTNTSETQLTRMTYLGGQGDDEVVGTDVGIVFQGNAGLDTITLDHYTSVADIIRFAKASDSILVLDGANQAVVEEMDTVYYFESGIDKIDLSGLHLAAGANRAGFATYSLISNNFEALADAIGNGVGFFNDGGTNRSLAFASHGGNDGWLMVDANGDGNYTAGVDMIINTYGNTSTLLLSDITWG
ncbi:MAG TPA: DUF4214 domain-containing protein [Telluria sp.]|nr:DUF4214 domain-containing protein [Telluria sp.]